MGTIGGSLANNDPAACYPAAVLGLGATITTNKRKIAADDFFKGLFETALETGELITAVTFPAAKRAGYIKFKNPGLALCAGRGVRGRDNVGRARCGHRGGFVRVPRARDREGAHRQVRSRLTCTCQHREGRHPQLDLGSAEYRRAHLIAVTGATGGWKINWGQSRLIGPAPAGLFLTGRQHEEHYFFETALAAAGPPRPGFSPGEEK